MKGVPNMELPFLISIIASISNLIAVYVKTGEKKAEKNPFFYNMMMNFLNIILSSINISINFIVFPLLY
ncbi:hypothetical protein D7322_20960 [Sphingobacterium puteale]|uniref:Uncharacterized protein n=1 Tax=Sphingobacterium puteale TaxID=2420510 RepID=A0A420VU01_9SPHI|nr:hypothetical protein D7322_20960 [Sphingobacterium puteale]